ncbi:hypothetical protein F7725_000533 [Dissostichus mawsoni]|uniref:Tetratricopeptide repeat domain 34 n=1 Tax=Dissostichus mawsoni TaxID=36200 RepID=A0A7J5ZIY0_DISMA|nr:hypothetical protein F7725_000533 [Dissostichus mawsoni]
MQNEGLCCLTMTAVVRPGVSVSKLCGDGDRLLRAGDLWRATSLYMSAFRTHAASTVSHMRKLKSGLDGVISTLESWLDSHGEKPPAEALNKGLAAVFLSTLCPNNLSATIFKMESLLQSGGHGCEEIFARCTALLEGMRDPYPRDASRMVLMLTGALACLFSEPHSAGLKLYLKAYKSNTSETVTMVKSRQAQHVPKIVKAFVEQVLHIHPSLTFDSQCAITTKDKEKLDVETSTILELLLAISPGNREVQELQAAYLCLSGRFVESAEVYSALLHHDGQNLSERSFQVTPERRAGLLTSRAAACLSAGGRTAEACRDLGEAFETHPANARFIFKSYSQIMAQGWLLVTISVSRQREACLGTERGSSSAQTCGPLKELNYWTLSSLGYDPADGGGRELRVRLADCLLLRGEHKEALSICSQLAAAKGQQSYQNMQVLRGYARLLSDDHKGALEDFQAVIEHDAPHPSSCVRALCGRGLLRMMGGSNYLTALDYVTASGLHPQETALTVRCLVPWNYRGLLFTVLLEQGRVMLEGAAEHKARSRTSEDSQQPQQGDKPQSKKTTTDQGIMFVIQCTEYAFFGENVY